jgi:Zn-dependent peptidase ImmA (M78 family)
MGMRPPVGKAEAIRRAKEFHAEHCYDQGERIDLVQVARSLGVTVLFHPLEDDDSGVLLVKGDKAIVLINEKHHENRQRFSLAHELAHFHLHRQKGVEVFHRDQISSLGTKRIEVEANAFAAELLMPEAELKAWAASTKLDPLDFGFDQVIAQKALKLGVSQQALNIRLDRLGLVRSDYYYLPSSVD